MPAEKSAGFKTFLLMSELIFRYGTMASGKSLHLLANAHNLKENHIPYQLLKPAIDTRDANKISSRVGLEHFCNVVPYEDNIIDFVNPLVKWVLIDEAQFLSEEQVNQLAVLVDKFNINVVCYGLRTDYLSHLFEGSKRLFELADKIEELPSYCECGSKTSINAKIDSNGEIEISDTGNQIEIGGDERYKAICRECFFDKVFCLDSTTVEEQ